jgi:hypothetical protein
MIMHIDWIKPRWMLKFQAKGMLRLWKGAARIVAKQGHEKGKINIDIIYSKTSVSDVQSRR